MDDCNRKSEELIEEIEGLVSYIGGGGADKAEGRPSEVVFSSSEERLKILFEFAPDGIYLNDLAGVFIDGNRAAEELTGYKREELIGKNFAEVGLLSAEELPKAIENLKKNAQGEPTEPHELTLRRKDGGSVAVEIRTFPVTIDGQVLSLGIARDITQRKLADETLRESEKRFRALAEKSPNMIFINVGGRVVYANDKCEEVMGYEKEEFCAEDFDFLTLITPGDRERVKEKFSKHMAGEEVEPYEYSLASKSGERIEAINATKLIEYRGDRAILGIVTDITERKRAERATEERLRFERMLSTISGRFVNLAVDEIDKTIEDGLGLVGEFFAVDRVTIGQLVGEESEARTTHIWHSRRCDGRVRDLALKAAYPHIAAYLERKGAFVYNKPEDLPKEWKEEREFVRASGVKSGVIVPLQVGGVFLGAVSINSLDSERVWPDGTVERLALAGEILANALNRKRTEKALRQSEGRYRSFVENFHGIAYRGMIDYTPTFFHGAVEEITGYVANDFVGGNSRWDRIIHKDDFAEIMKTSGKRIAEIPGAMEDRAYRIIRKDGRIRWVREFIRNICDDQSKPAFVEGVIYDITPQKEAKKALEKSERFLRDIFDAIQDGISILDCDLNIVRVNGWMEKMYTGQMPLVGKKCYEVYQHRQSSCPWCPSLSTIESGNVCRTTVPYPCAENAIGWIELSAFPLMDANDCVVGVIEHVKDITERKQAEEKAREHQSELAHVWRVNTMGEMASGLAHELNQPLCAILNYANACLRMMKKDVDVSGELFDPIEQIASQAERAGEIIKRIRGLVAKRKPQTSAVDINGIVMEVVEMEKAEASHKGIIVRTEPGEDLPFAFVDSVEIEEVILNLVRNAFDAMSDSSIERREVTIATCMTKDGYVEICVRDTGKGFAALGEQIFDSFFTTKIDGLGIGLSISRTIVESHGGKLWAEQNPDCGASFRFTVPIRG